MSEMVDNFFTLLGFALIVIVPLAALASVFEYQSEKLPKNEFDAKRLEDNLEILEILKKYVEDHPEQRFGQMLKNLEVFERKIVQERGMEEWESGSVWIDHKVVHDEPSIILERMKKSLANK